MTARYKYSQPSPAKRMKSNCVGRDAAGSAPPGANLWTDSLAPAARNLQHSIGNQSVLRLLRSRTEASPREVAILGAPQPSQPADAGPAQAQPAQVTQTPSPSASPGQPAAPAATQPKPYTAMFSIAQHGSRAHQVCGLPDTPNCVVSWAKWRLVDATGAPVMGKVTVQEKFTKISGPDDVFQKLDAQKNQSITSDGGGFDDCYGLCVPDGTPAFSLQVQQNYLVDGQIAAQNILTYSPTGVMIRVCQREPNGNFGTRCRRF